MPFTPCGSRRTPPAGEAFFGAAAAVTESASDEAKRHRPSLFSIEPGYHPSKSKRQTRQQAFHRPVRGLWRTRQHIEVTRLIEQCAMPRQDLLGELPSPPR